MAKSIDKEVLDTMNTEKRPYPEGIAFDEAWRQRKRADAMEKSRDSWRAACRYLYEVIGEGGKRGRPLDLIGSGDYGRIVAMIGKAESFEPESVERLESAEARGRNGKTND